MDRHDPEARPASPEHRPGGTGGLGAGFRPLRLVVERGPDAGRRFVVGKAGATIGRAEGNTIALADPAVSRDHARLEVWDTPGGAAVMARDLGSAHGTRLNGAPLAAPAPLRPGDTLELGATALRAEAAFGSAALAPAGAPAAPVPRAVLRTEWHARGPSAEPVYELRGALLYRRRWHERGAGREPDYELRGGALYRTAHHERGAGRLPDYELRGEELYRTQWHPDGLGARPDYHLEGPGAAR